LALLGDHAHVVWEERPYNSHIFQDYWSGGTWHPDVQVSTFDSHNPAIATDDVNGYVYVVFDRDSNIWCAKSTGNGNTFGAEVEVTGPERPVWLDPFTND